MSPQSHPERIGVFGGTFDPPHVGHLVTAVNVRHALGLDRMLLVVANEPWQKVDVRPVSPAADRLAMVSAAVQGVEGLAASDLEVMRGGPSYTVDTLEALRAASPGAELFVVLGADAAAGLDTWERAADVVALATLVVVDRPAAGALAAPEPAPLPVPGARVVRVEVPRLEVSSTDLRARVADGRPLDYLITADVMTCIRERRLYGQGR